MLGMHAENLKKFYGTQLMDIRKKIIPSEILIIIVMKNISKLLESI